MLWARRAKETASFLVGAVTGGASQEKVIAASVALRAKALDRVEDIGASLGRAGTGSTVFERLREGARGTDRAESERFFVEKAGISPARVKAGLVALVILGLLLVLVRGR